MPNVLVFTPTWEVGDGNAIHPACAAAIQAQRDSFDGRIEWCIGLENPYPVGDHRNVLAQYQKARNILLADSHHDAILTVEHDNAPEGCTLAKMYATEADVVYAPYLLRHGSAALSAWQYINDTNLGMPLGNYPDELQSYRGVGVGRVSGVGFGCTLIRRHVLEALEFRPDGSSWCPDIPFAVDCLRAGFLAMGRFDTPVAHYENGVKLEAYTEVNMSKYLALETCNAMAAGRFVRLTAGEEIELTEREAADLQRVGFIRSLVAETAMLETPETAMLRKPRGKRV